MEKKGMVLAFVCVAMLVAAFELQAVDEHGVYVVEVIQHGNEHGAAGARGIPLIRFSAGLSGCGGDTYLWVPSGSAQKDIISLAMAALIHHRVVDVAYINASSPWGFHCRLDRLTLK